MEWFSQNWVWMLFFAGIVAMHVFGHGGHGGRAGHGGAQSGSRPQSQDNVQRNPEQGSDHQH